MPVLAVNNSARYSNEFSYHVVHPSILHHAGNVESAQLYSVLTVTFSLSPRASRACSAGCAYHRGQHDEMDNDSGPLPPLHCSLDTCSITRLLPSAAFPLTYDDTSHAWHACTTLAHLCHLQLHYYHAHLPFTPTYNGALHSESQPILPSLAAIVSSGLFMPTFSQPAVDEDEYNCYYVRTGCPQRAAVSGWTNEAGMKRLRAEWHKSEAEPSHLHVCITAPAHRSHPTAPPVSFCLHPPHLPCIVPISRVPHSPGRPSIRQRLGLPPLQQTDEPSPNEWMPAVVTSVGGGRTRYEKELEDWRRQLGGEGRRCMELDGWMVWMVDEQWGRKQHLWPFLVQALTAD